MNEALNNLISERMELKEKIVRLDELKKEKETRIKMMMEQEGLHNYEDDVGNYATYKEITSNRLDKKLVEERMPPEKFQECFKESTSSRLTIISPEERERRKAFK